MNPWVIPESLHGLILAVTGVPYGAPYSKTRNEQLFRFAEQHTERDPGRCSGAEVLRGTRLRTRTVQEHVDAGDTHEDIKAAFRLTDEQFVAAILARGLRYHGHDLDLSQSNIDELPSAFLPGMTALVLRDQPDDAVTLTYLAEALGRSGGAGLELLAQLSVHPRILVREGAAYGLRELPCETALSILDHALQVAKDEAQAVPDGGRIGIIGRILQDEHDTITETLSQRTPPEPGQWWVLRPEQEPCWETLPADLTPLPPLQTPHGRALRASAGDVLAELPSIYNPRGAL